MKNNLITKTLFLTMGLCVASGITATLVSTNKSATATFAAIGDTFKKDGLKYKVTAEGDVNTVSVIKYDEGEEPSGEIAIPAKVTNNEVEYSVTRIDDNAFAHCNDLTNVVIPESVTIIGSGAFYTCDLRNLTIPSFVTSIGNSAFANNTHLKNLNFGGGSLLESIGDSAFNSCVFETVTIPEFVTSIGNEAFAWGQLESVNVRAATIPTLGSEAFDYNNDVSIYVPEDLVEDYNGAQNWQNYNIVAAYTVNITPTTNGTVSVDQDWFHSDEYVEEVEAVTVTATPADGCTLKSLKYNDGEDHDIIATRWFAMPLKSVTVTAEFIKTPVVGDTFTDNGINYVITSVGDTNTVKVGDNTTFTGTSVIVPSTVTYNDVTFDVTEIDKKSFERCGQLTTVTFANNSKITTICDEAFHMAGITEIEIPSSVTNIGNYAFNSCSSLTKVTFVENSELTTIGKWAFSDCAALAEIEIPTGVTSIDDGAFNCCIELAEIEIPASVKTLGKNCFCSSKLTKVTFASNSQLKKIDAWAFEEIGLAEIEIPESISEINNEAFYNCANLSVVTILATDVPVTRENIFGGCAKLTTIFVPASSVDAYKTAWTDYASKIKALHNHAIKETHPAVEPTCLVAGHKAYYECDCGKYFSDEALTQEITNLDAWLAEDGDGYIAPKGHSFGGEVTYTWNEETHECTAIWKCQREGCNDTQTETVTGVYVKDTDATTESNEKGHYEATFSISDFKKQSTPANSVEIPDTKLPSKGLSGGAIAGIAAGSVVGVCLITYVAMFFVWKKNEKALKFLKPSFAWVNKKIFRK